MEHQFRYAVAYFVPSPFGVGNIEIIRNTPIRTFADRQQVERTIAETHAVTADGVDTLPQVVIFTCEPVEAP